MVAVRRTRAVRGQHRPGSLLGRPKFKDGHKGLRLIVSDEHGNEYDEAVHDMGWNQFWVKSVKAFPRRGKEVRFRLAEQTDVFPAFVIPNPDPGPHPVWKANPLPVTSTNDNLEVKLVLFRSLQAGESTFTGPGRFPKTELAFQVFEDRQPTTNWHPVSLFLSDATGNHWNASRSSDWNKIDGRDIKTTVSGALWPGEDAWKLELEFRKTGGFKQSELVRLERIPIPGPDPRVSNGSATVTVSLSDNGGTANGGVDTSNAQTFTITVTPVNDAPIAVADNKSTNEDTQLSFAAADLLANDLTGPSNESDQTLTVISVTATADTHGKVSLSGSTITYIPGQDYNGPASFEYRIQDDGTTGGNPDPLSAIGTVEVEVISVNDIPIVTIDSIVDDAGRVLDESDSIFVGQQVFLTGSFTDPDQPD